MFQAALCLLLYNLTVVVRAYVAEGGKRTTDDVSMEKLFVDICRQLTGIVEVLGTPAVVRALRRREMDRRATADLPRHRVERRLARLVDEVAAAQKSKPTPTEYLKGGHSSVYKIVCGLHETIPETKRPAKEQQRPSKQ